jgi:hypothetical protein
MLVGLVAGYGGLVRYLARTRGRVALPLAVGRVGHQVLGWVFVVLLAGGYGLGLLAVHRTGRALLTGPHALVGTVVLTFAAIVMFLGTALANREEERLGRLHRLFGAALLVLIALQATLGLNLLLG